MIAPVIPALLVLSLLAPLQTTVTYTSADGHTQLGMDVYTPAGAPLGAVIAVHGGGWHSGTRLSMAKPCEALMADGYLCFAPGYRLAPEHPYPAALLDLEQAAAWIEANYGYGPNQLIGFGTSAGANLVAMLDVLGYVAKAAVWSPPTDLTTILSQGCPCVSPVTDYVPSDQAKHDASPVFYVDASDGPVRITNSDAEIIPLAQAYELRDALDVAGVAWVLHVRVGSLHAMKYFGKEWPGTRMWLEAP